MSVLYVAESVADTSNLWRDEDKAMAAPERFAISESTMALRMVIANELLDTSTFNHLSADERAEYVAAARTMLTTPAWTVRPQKRDYRIREVTEREREWFTKSVRTVDI